MRLWSVYYIAKNLNPIPDRIGNDVRDRTSKLGHEHDLSLSCRYGSLSSTTRLRSELPSIRHQGTREIFSSAVAIAFMALVPFPSPLSPPPSQCLAHKPRVNSNVYALKIGCRLNDFGGDTALECW